MYNHYQFKVYFKIFPFHYNPNLYKANYFQIQKRGRKKKKKDNCFSFNSFNFSC